MERHVLAVPDGGAGGPHRRNECGVWLRTRFAVRVPLQAPVEDGRARRVSGALHGRAAPPTAHLRPCGRVGVQELLQLHQLRPHNNNNIHVTCAGNSSDGWFQAHFSDVPRLRRVRSAADPGYVFHSYVTRARSPCVCAARTAEEKAVKAATLTRPRKGGATGAAGGAKAYPHRESMPRGHRVAFNASERGRAGCGHPRKSLKALKLLRARTDLSLVPGFVRGPPMATATHGSQPMQRHRQSGFAMPISCSDAAVTWNWASLSGLKNPSYGRCADSTRPLILPRRHSSTTQRQCASTIFTGYAS